VAGTCVKQVEGGMFMNNIQLPSRVMDVFAALKTQGYSVEFSVGSNYDILFKVFSYGELSCYGYLLTEKDYDFSDDTFEMLTRFVGNTKLYRKSVIVRDYLEDKFSH
jgi:hypothetical protein